MKLLKLIANLGYGSRREVLALFADGRVRDAEGALLYGDDEIDPTQVVIDGAPLDPAPGMLLMLHKPVGYTCSHRDQGRLVYDLFPPRFRARKPVLSSAGRLDRDTSGLLLFTDDGQLLHRIVSPKAALTKVYRARLADSLRGDEAALFASGSLMLDGETRPLLPAQLVVMSEREVELHLHEGRYHQVRRMFAAVSNHVTELHRARIGGLTLDGLPEGEWRLLDAEEQRQLFDG